MFIMLSFIAHLFWRAHLSGAMYDKSKAKVKAASSSLFVFVICLFCREVSVAIAIARRPSRQST